MRGIATEKRKIRRKLGSLEPSHMAVIMADWQRLVAEGLQSEKDLAALALDRSHDARVRRIACWFMGRALLKRLAEPALVRLAADTRELALLRCEAIHSLGIIKSRKGLPLLEKLALGEQDLQVRTSSMYALGKVYP